MRLLTKGLLIVAIPGLFEIVLLAALFKSQADAADAERQPRGEDDQIGRAHV